MPPTTAPTLTRARRRSVALALQLAAALLATGAASATDTGELVWLGESGGQAEVRWTTDPSVRPWRDADGRRAAYQDGQPVVLHELAVNRTVVVADPGGVAHARCGSPTGRAATPWTRSARAASPA